MQTMVKVRLLVSGRVQGVFFRQSTRDMACSLGLLGWVRNLASGQVEIEAFGGAEAIEQLCLWCQKGPPAASVASVSVESRQAVEQCPFADFQIEH